MAREMTNYLLEAAANGEISWEAIARGCLVYMSEDEVVDMSICEELVSSDTEDDEDDCEDYEEGDRIEESPFLRENDPDTDLFDGDIYAVYHE